MQPHPLPGPVMELGQEFKEQNDGINNLEAQWSVRVQGQVSAPATAILQGGSSQYQATM